MKAPLAVALTKRLKWTKRRKTVPDAQRGAEAPTAEAPTPEALEAATMAAAAAVKEVVAGATEGMPTPAAVVALLNKQERFEDEGLKRLLVGSSEFYKHHIQWPVRRAVDERRRRKTPPPLALAERPQRHKNPNKYRT